MNSKKWINKWKNLSFIKEVEGHSVSVAIKQWEVKEKLN